MKEVEALSEQRLQEIRDWLRTQPHCLGYHDAGPACDGGDLVGEEHTPPCPLTGRTDLRGYPSLPVAELLAAYSAELQAELTRSRAALLEKRNYDAPLHSAERTARVDALLKQFPDIRDLAFWALGESELRDRAEQTADQRVLEVERQRDELRRRWDEEEPLRSKVARYEEAWAEMSKCDDVRLNQPLADAIYELFRQRENYRDLYLAAEQKLAEQRWIPVSEKLPPDSTSVLTFVDKHRGIVCVNQRRLDYWDSFNASVTHWRELPAAPRVEREG